MHLLVTLAIPVASFGVRSWWLVLAGQHVPGCDLDLVVEHEDGRGLRYEHDISCGDQLVEYTSRGDPIGQAGQTLDMMLDPAGIIAAMPAHSAPTWYSWATPLALAAVVTTVVVELVRTRRRTEVEAIESVD